jgi:alginate biosynthesis protein AlgX
MLPFLRTVALAVAFAVAGAFCGVSAQTTGTDRKGDLLCPGLAEAAARDFSLSEGRDSVFFRTSTDLEQFFAVTAETVGLFRLLNEAFAATGTALVLIPLPTRGIVQAGYLNETEPSHAVYDRDEARAEYGILVEQLRSAGLSVVDVLAPIEEQDAARWFFFHRDHHWTPQGARLAAREAARIIRALPPFGELATHEFTTREESVAPYTTEMGYEIQRLCKRAMPAEQITLFKTVRQASSADDLLGSGEQGAPVALVGSSFSATADFNFAGFLSEFTGLEVANHAIRGAEFVGSLASLVSARNFASNRPRIVMWETPSYYEIDGLTRAAFRQIIPAIYGACSDDDAVALSQPMRVDGEAMFFGFDEQQTVGGPEQYLVFEASAPGVEGLNASVTYSSGEREIVPLGNLERYRDDGRFFLSLSRDIRGHVSRVSIEGDSDGETIAARICTMRAAAAGSGS